MLTRVKRRSTIRGVNMIGQPFRSLATSLANPDIIYTSKCFFGRIVIETRIRQFLKDRTEFLLWVFFMGIQTKTIKTFIVFWNKTLTISGLKKVTNGHRTVNDCDADHLETFESERSDALERKVERIKRSTVINSYYSEVNVFVPSTMRSLSIQSLYKYPFSLWNFFNRSKTS